MSKKYLLILIVLVIIIGLIFLFKPNSTGNVVLDEAEILKIPLSQVSTKVDFYNYNSNGVDIEYFVVKAKDGSIKTAFNACDVCYRSKKGYRQEGNDIICNNCGNYYAISGLGTKNLRGGGCWPGYLPSKVDGDFLIIKKSDLEQEKYRFA